MLKNKILCVSELNSLVIEKIYNTEKIEININPINEILTKDCTQPNNNQVKTPTFREIFILKQKEYENRESVVAYEVDSLKAGSIITYNSYLESRFDEFLDIEIAKFCLDHVINFIDKHRDRGNSYDYVKNLFIPLREIVSDYHDRGIISSNVFKNEYIKKHMRRNLKKTEKLPMLLDDNDLKLLLNAPHSYIRSTVLFGLFTGARVAEMLGYNYNMLNFSKNRIYITKQQLKIGVPSSPKSPNSIREIPIIISSDNNTENPYSNVLSDILIFEYNRRVSDSVFIDPETQQRWKDSDKVNREMRKLFSQLGITKRITYHDLRYWFTAYTIKLVGIQEASKLLGHKTIEETMRDYTRVKPANLLSKEEAEKLKVFNIAPELPHKKGGDIK